MITRRVRLQVIAFLIIALVGTGYTAVTYGIVGRIIGNSGYPVALRLADSGGIFVNAEVTYRGVTVGRVESLTLTQDGVQAGLVIEEDMPIPADLDAVVANRSAVGEQYVDLRPVRDGGPVLEEGSVIPVSATTTPVPVETLLLNLDQFARSVPLDSLRTVVDELGTAVADTGPDLQRLLDSSRTLTNDAVATLPQQLALIRDGRTVLDTQNEQAAAITSFSRDLRLLAEQLRISDPDIRRLIATTPQFSTQTVELLAESGPQLGALIADLLTTSRITLPRLDAVEQTLVIYPVVLFGDDTVNPGDGRAHFGLVQNAFDPYPCTDGYQSTPIRSAAETSNIPSNREAYCAEPRGSETAVRGAQNAPTPGPPPDAVDAAAPSGGEARPSSGGGPGRPMTDLVSVLRDPAPHR